MATWPIYKKSLLGMQLVNHKVIQKAESILLNVTTMQWRRDRIRPKRHEPLSPAQVVRGETISI